MKVKELQKDGSAANTAINIDRQEGGLSEERLSVEIKKWRIASGVRQFSCFMGTSKSLLLL